MNHSNSYNAFEIQTIDERAQSRIYDHCLNCGSTALYVHIGHCGNPEMLAGYVGPTWDLRCDACDYGVSPYVPLGDKDTRIAQGNEPLYREWDSGPGSYRGQLADTVTEGIAEIVALIHHVDRAQSTHLTLTGESVDGYFDIRLFTREQLVRYGLLSPEAPSW